MTQYLTYTISEGGSRVTAIRQDIRHINKRILVHSKGCQHAFSVRHISGSHRDSMGKSLVVHGNMLLDTGHLFTRVIPFFTRRVRVPDTLRINYHESGVDVPTMVDADLANDIFLKLARAGWVRFLTASLSKV
ncbi:hypothetical protein Xhom_03991 [Xenorhabdus hominickii]|uniref:Uncharacterized protein n=1 Tax=Xenorhabdus hominickii TaxID=351679 RepID=A0A2G0Q1L4_XENHO|nr:hypothetical protein Xhom_03991 [Xenorhabdus hominickii]